MNENACRGKRFCDKKEAASTANRGGLHCRGAITKLCVPFVIASLRKKRNAFYPEIRYV